MGSQSNHVLHPFFNKAALPAWNAPQQPEGGQNTSEPQHREVTEPRQTRVQSTIGKSFRIEPHQPDEEPALDFGGDGANDETLAPRKRRRITKDKSVNVQAELSTTTDRSVDVRAESSTTTGGSVDVQADLSTTTDRSVDVQAELPRPIMDQAEDVHAELPRPTMDQSEVLQIELPRSVMAQSQDVHAELPRSVMDQSQDVQAELSNTHEQDSLHNEQRHDTPPRKMLRLTGNGKFSSPPSRAIKHDRPQPKKRGRPKKVQPAKELIVVISYSASVGQSVHDNASTGQKIDDILNGRLQVRPPPTTPKRRTPRKPTHPFFSDKPKAKPPKQESPRKTAAVTPGKLKTQTRPDTIHDTHVFESALLKDRHMTKYPGAQEALWPPRDMVHVRAVDFVPKTPLTLSRRKLKGVRRHIMPHDSLLASYTQLKPEAESRLRPDGFREPHHDLNIPERHLISGVDLNNAVLKEVNAPLRQGEQDELSPLSASQTAIHPALTHVYSTIPSYLSGFDELRGESHNLATRHAPTSAATVLQPASDTTVIKTWLQALTVNSVGTSQTEVLKPRKKRKARPEDLDDFIVDEDEDSRSMITVSDVDSTDTALRSVVQTQVKGVRANNALIISGPNGCGKTAAVFAVAKELNYRVFEISSAERRSGKDVLDKIGNVLDNHMVKHHSNDAETAEESHRIDAAFAKDVETGRQGKMSNFFKPAGTAKSVQKATITAKSLQSTGKAKVMSSLQKLLKKPTKEQQQSLILLEEVDILFKEDKEFWSTVLRLISSSKRPFILTCNDEDLVPLQSIQLHAILRFSAPPTDLAIDYLLLIAAKEGHLLQRSAVVHLWESSGHDLRRSLNTLDFWCRMGVGDIRDGLTWMYQRWPVGTDVDQKGRKLRVVSRGTFHAALACGTLSSRTETHRSETTQPGETVSGPETWPICETMARSEITESLRTVDHLTTTLSDMDVFSQHNDLDQTLPDISDKQRLHYIDGMSLLDTKPRQDYSMLSTNIESYASKLIAWSPPRSPSQLSRRAFAVFDGLANPVYSSATLTGMEISVFDGPLAPITVDIAPYVRQIFRHDLMLEQQRDLLAGPNKKARKTRAAMSALEGGQRQLVRRQWWWEGVGDLTPVLATAGDGWAEAERAVLDHRIIHSSDSSHNI